MAERGEVWRRARQLSCVEVELEGWTKVSSIDRSE